MNFTLNLPLENLSLIKIAVSLLKGALNEKILGSFNNLRKLLQDVIMDLNIPDSLKEKLFNVISPIYRELRQYLRLMQSYQPKPRFLVIALSTVCFTSVGTIDYKKSAQAMLQHRRLKAHERLIIACNNCLEDEISRLCVTCLAVRCQWNIREHSVLKFWWDALIHADVLSQATPFQLIQAFYASVKELNVVAAEYFFEKLPSNSKVPCLKVCLGKLPLIQSTEYSINYRNIRLFLFSKFEKADWEAIKHIFCKLGILCLTIWPYQDILMKHVKSLFKDIPLNLFAFMIKRFAGKIERKCADYDYLYLLKEILNLFSQDYKEGLLILFPNDHDLCSRIFNMLK